MAATEKEEGMRAMQPEDEHQFSVSIETRGERPDADALEEFSSLLDDFGARGPSVGAGGLGGGGTATFGVAAPLPLPEESASVIQDVCNSAVRMFVDAASKAGIEFEYIARVDVMSEPYLDAWLRQEPEEYAGVSEVAGILGVSRQRVSELRAREDFPAPIAELAAGPVWRVSNLRRFIDEWPRKPGRPRRRKKDG